MKTTFLLLFVVAVSLGVARAQDADYYDNSTYAPADYQAPAVVYEAPVVYAAPVVYQAPVVYYAPVYYGAPMAYALNACAACENNAARSTVTFIGGGQARFQVSPRCNNGSTVVFIGGQSRFR